MTHSFDLRRMTSAAVLAGAALLAAPDALATCVSVGAVSCVATVSATNLAFGNYNPTSAAPNSATSTVTVQNTVTGVGVLATVGFDLSLSAGTGGSIAARVLNGPSGAQLRYNLYADPGYATVWGNGTVTDSVSALATVGGVLVTRSFTVYGRIPPNQFVAPGAYANTITVTVNF